jgi:hypothetical protein
MSIPAQAGIFLIVLVNSSFPISSKYQAIDFSLNTGHHCVVYLFCMLPVTNSLPLCGLSSAERISLIKE